MESHQPNASCLKDFAHIGKKLDEVSDKTEKQDKRIDKLEQSSVRLEERLANLITKMENLNKTMMMVAMSIFGSIVAIAINTIFG